MDNNTLRRVEIIEQRVRGLAELEQQRVDAVEARTEQYLTQFTQDIELRLAGVEAKAVQYINLLGLQVLHRINRIYFHSSPGLILILTTIATVVKTVVKIVQLIMNSQVARLILTVHKVLYAVWGRYKEAVNNLIKQVSDVSKAIGLGADGLVHLMNAFESSVGLIAGLKGSDWQGFENDFYYEVQKSLGEISTKAIAISKDPEKWLRDIFLVGQESEYYKGKQWWEQTGNWIATNIEKANTALEGLDAIVTELQQFGVALPEFIAQHIPAAIWSGLSDVQTFIHYKVQPALDKFERKFTEVNNILTQYTGKFEDITDRMAHPGDLLLGVDDLPDYARDAQLALIDDVTSRQFAEGVDSDRAALSDTIEAFDKVAEAMSVPTPEPAFLSIESPARRAATGIVEQPRETWFVGDY